MNLKTTKVFNGGLNDCDLARASRSPQPAGQEDHHRCDQGGSIIERQRQIVSWPGSVTREIRDGQCDFAVARICRWVRRFPPGQGRPPSSLIPPRAFEAPSGGARSAHTCSACHDTASEGADSSKTRFHRQMISIAAAITIPVTNAVKQEKSSRSLKTTLMAASPCGSWSTPRA